MRYVLPGVLFLAALLLAGCGADTPTATPIVIVVTATPGAQDAPTAIPPTPVPTATAVPASATPDAAATAAVLAQATAVAEDAARAALAVQVQATQTQEAGAAAEATAQAEVAAAQTEEAQPTETPTPLPSFGDTVEYNDWRISLAKQEIRTRLPYDSLGRWYRPGGQFLLLWVDARNLTNSSRSLRDTLDWGVLDDQGAIYEEQWTTVTEKDQENFTQAVYLEGRSPLFANVTPRGVTHALLIFDVAADATATQLAIVPHGATNPVVQWFDLTRKRK